MWTYTQGTGMMYNPDGTPLAQGYSGNWDGTQPPGGPTDYRNQSADQALHNQGPIPVGTYTIGAAFDDPGGKGPVVMRLTPDPNNQMFGRAGFMIHGDLAPPLSGQASDGCIILDHPSRQTIADSGDDVLIVG
jgi:hypothetical protein